MKQLLFLILLQPLLFSHGFIQHKQDQEKKEIYQERYGAFVDIQYRNKDLYPNGFNATHGYELHGTPKTVEVEHLGLFYAGSYQNFSGAIELNSHNGSDSSLDEMVERAFIGYNSPYLFIRVGRAEYAISQVENKPYGYGFSQMPLMLNTFFSGSFYGDGVSLNLHTEHLNLQLDTLADMYSKYAKYSAKLSYKNHIYHHNFQLFSYYQKQPTVNNKLSTINSVHSHTSNCRELSNGEFCFEGERNIYGLGVELNTHSFNFLSEVLYNDEKGDIHSLRQNINEEAKQYSAYSQIIIPIKGFNVGYRYEHFWFENKYNGLGAKEITTTLLGTTPQKTQSLSTAMLSYTYKKSHNFKIEYQYSKEERAVNFQYLFIFDSGFKN